MPSALSFWKVQAIHGQGHETRSARSVLMNITFCKPRAWVFSVTHHDTPAEAWLSVCVGADSFLCPSLPIPFILSHCLIAEMHVPAALMAKLELPVTDGKQHLQHTLLCFGSAFSLSSVLHLLWSFFFHFHSSDCMFRRFPSSREHFERRAGVLFIFLGGYLWDLYMGFTGVGPTVLTDCGLVFCCFSPQGIKTVLPPLSFPPKAPVTMPRVSPGRWSPQLLGAGTRVTTSCIMRRRNTTGGWRSGEQGTLPAPTPAPQPDFLFECTLTLFLKFFLTLSLKFLLLKCSWFTLSLIPIV